jgi:hypothetical protein
MLMLVPAQHLSDFRALSAVVHERAAVFDILERQLSVGRDTVKKLILAVCYGGSLEKQLLELASYRGPPPQILTMLSMEVRSLAEKVATDQPAQLAVVRAEKKPQPEISLLSHHMAHMQRSTMESIAGTPDLGLIVSYERDALVVLRKGMRAPSLVVPPGIQVKVEPYPTEQAVLVEFQKRYKYMDFSMESQLDIEDIMTAWNCCITALAPQVHPKTGEVKFLVRRNITDFGLVIASMLEPCAIVASNEGIGFGKWRVVKEVEVNIKKHVRQLLLNVFRRTGLVYEDGKLTAKYFGAPPPQCKEIGFYSSVSSDVKLHLFKGEPLVRMDSQSMRRFLVDKDGRIYDTLQDVIFKGNPFIRVSLHLPWAFFPKNTMRSAAQVWDAPPEVVRTVEAFLGEVTTYWLSGDGPRGKSIMQHPLVPPVAGVVPRLQVGLRRGPLVPL